VFLSLGCRAKTKCISIPIKQKLFHMETEGKIKYLNENCLLQHLFSVPIIFFVLSRTYVRRNCLIVKSTGMNEARPSTKYVQNTSMD
jgi:hypothetical protein